MWRELATLGSVGLVVVGCTVFGTAEDSASPAADDGGSSDAAPIDARGTYGPSDLQSGTIKEIARAAQPVSLATDTGNVYFVDRVGGTVNVVPKGGGALRTMAGGRSTPDFLSVIGDYVYWLEQVPCVGGQASIFRIKKDATAPEAVWGIHQGGEACFGITSLTQDAVSLYAVKDRTIVQLSPPAVAPATSSTNIANEANDTPVAVAADTTAVYWAVPSKNVIRRYAQPTGPTVDLTTTTGMVEAIAADGARVYWIERGVGIKSVARGASNAVPTLLAAETEARRFALRGDGIYFTSTEGGRIGHVPNTGGPITTIASTKAPFAIVADEDGLYFGSLEGTVSRIIPATK